MRWNSLGPVQRELVALVIGVVIALLVAAVVPI